jgi:hypothetical protein
MVRQDHSTVLHLSSWSRKTVRSLGYLPMVFNFDNRALHALPVDTVTRKDIAGRLVWTVMPRRRIQLKGGDCRFLQSTGYPERLPRTRRTG